MSERIRQFLIGAGSAFDLFPAPIPVPTITSRSKRKAKIFKSYERVGDNLRKAMLQYEHGHKELFPQSLVKITVEAESCSEEATESREQ